MYIYNRTAQNGHSEKRTHVLQCMDKVPVTDWKSHTYDTSATSEKRLSLNSGQRTRHLPQNDRPLYKSLCSRGRQPRPEFFCSCAIYVGPYFYPWQRHTILYITSSSVSLSTDTRLTSSFIHDVHVQLAISHTHWVRYWGAWPPW